MGVIDIERLHRLIIIRAEIFQQRHQTTRHQIAADMELGQAGYAQPRNRHLPDGFAVIGAKIALREMFDRLALSCSELPSMRPTVRPFTARWPPG